APAAAAVPVPRGRRMGICRPGARGRRERTRGARGARSQRGARGRRSGPGRRARRAGPAARVAGRDRPTTEGGRMTSAGNVAGAGRQAAITGVGSAVPERIVPNAFFEDLVDTTDEWIRERTGIRERRFAGEGETTGSLSTLAGQRALDAAGISPQSIDLIVVA